MMNIDFRKLKEKEIDVRVGGVYKAGITLLLYKDARVDMRVLDETVGAFNWQRAHEEHKGVLYCRVGINLNYKNPELPPYFIWKEDAGAESYSEKEKGEASDSFKRACFNWGIGRELYTGPDYIFVPNKDVKIEDGKVKDSFRVRYIEYKDDEISCLTIENKRKELIFSYGSPA